MTGDTVAKAYREVFGSAAGRVVRDDLQRILLSASYTKGDPYETAFREGRRDVVRRIEAMIRQGERDVSRPDGSSEES